MKHKTFYTIGVTGGIGSGKSTVAQMLADRGATVIDADRISHEVTFPGKPALVEIAEVFGSDIVVKGTLNRERLAAAVFSDNTKKKQLEDIVHGHVVQEMDERLHALQEAGFKGLVVLDVPIPVSRGFLDVCDTIWVVDCAIEIRIARVHRRSGWPEDDIRKRMQSQLDREAYLRLANDVLDSEADMECLTAQVEDLLKKKILPCLRMNLEK